MQDGIQQLLTPRELAGLRNLNIESRFTVEGSLQGAHRSPGRGFSVEFADYRQYVSGDDLRHLDWKVYARNERLYIRQYEEECNLRVYLLVDGSASMGFRGDASLSKYEFGAKLASALAYVTIQQQDSVGLSLFDRRVVRQLPARGGRGHLRLVGNFLAEHTPGKTTDVAQTLHRLADSVQRRALVVIISDLFDDLEPIHRALAHFRRRHHDVIVYQVMDPAEVDFPYDGLGRFEDMETGEEMLTDPVEIRQSYRESVAEFLQSCRRVCAGLDVDYCFADSSESPVELIRRHFARRKRR
jgi:uncharacterized protein (DUF58 family)